MRLVKKGYDSVTLEFSLDEFKQLLGLEFVQEWILELEKLKRESWASMPEGTKEHKIVKY